MRALPCVLSCLGAKESGGTCTARIFPFFPKKRNEKKSQGAVMEMKILFLK